MRTCSWRPGSWTKSRSNRCGAMGDRMRGIGPYRACRSVVSFTHVTIGALTSFLLLATIPQAPAAQSADSLELARQRVTLALEDVTLWNGPTSGPKAAPGKVVAFIA